MAAMEKDKTDYDPGWNDPPPISFEKGCEITANCSSKRTSLNKRVAVPLNKPYKPGEGGQDPTIPPSALDLTKIGSPPVGLPPVTRRTSSESLSSAEPNVTSKPPTDMRDCLREVVNNLRSAGGSLPLIDEEISKRLTVMENLWLDNKLSHDVQLRILKLSEAVKCGDLVAADKIQMGLMVDHVGQCSSWMGGVRQLINKLRTSAKPSPSVSQFLP